MNWQERVLVTGGAGFIGSQWVRTLLNEDAVSEVRILDHRSSDLHSRLANASNHPKLKVFEANIRDLAVLRKAMRNTSSVFHFAAQASSREGFDEPSKDTEGGLDLTLYVLEAMRLEGVPNLCYASSSAVYGTPSNGPLREHTTELSPVSHYAAAKAAGEMFVRSYAKLYGIKYLVVRFGNLIGAYMERGVLFDIFRMLRMEERRVELLGDGSQGRTYIEVQTGMDVLRNVVNTCFTQGRSDVVNLSGIGMVTVADIVQIIREHAPFDIEIEFGAKTESWKGDVVSIDLCTDKLQRNYRQHLPRSIDQVDAVIQQIIKTKCDGFVTL